MTDTVKDLRKSLDTILALDPNAVYEFEDYGSGTTGLNIIFSPEALKKLTLRDLEKLEKVGVAGDDEGETLEEKLMGEKKNMLFICL